MVIINALMILKTLHSIEIISFTFRLQHFLTFKSHLITIFLTVLCSNFSFLGKNVGTVCLVYCSKCMHSNIAMLETIIHLINMSSVLSHCVSPPMCHLVTSQRSCKWKLVLTFAMRDQDTLWLYFPFFILPLKHKRRDTETQVYVHSTKTRQRIVPYKPY